MRPDPASPPIQRRDLRAIWIERLGIALASVIGLVTVFMLGRGSVLRSDSEIQRAFHILYVNKRWENIQDNTRWLGVSAMKTPLDLWVYQEILYETRPDVLVETGTHNAGSAFFYATVFDALGKGRIYTMDVEDFPRAKHPRINFRLSSSVADETLDWIQKGIQAGEKVMVTLDSLHDKEHVLAELDRYSILVSPGCYLVVEDTHLNGHPIKLSFTPSPGHDGPWEAVEEWLPKHPEFQRDRSREKFGLTFNNGGWLKRVR